jgi:hypothetical protein
MNIIELAKQAGFGIDEAPIDQPYVIQPLHGKIDDELTRFAALVRAAALEENEKLQSDLRDYMLAANAEAELVDELQEENAYLDRIASELQDTCHKQAERLAESEALLRQALDCLDLYADIGIKGAEKIIDAIKERLI